eukprot:TRINITY_DN10723_c0_g1_i1.p1 TRINITY_DN10723_c0_g1~~TRINITY_DN10723_c0_g1_i1.p1  ORF type:complete len:410 (+),score=139.50 TRINITY_DN10723_c0_g1_i1:46-1275(+)
MEEVYRDLTGKSLLTYGVFADGLRRHEIHLDDETVNELFTKADEDCNGVINGAEWTKFCEYYPTLVDCLLHKVRDNANMRGYDTSEMEAEESIKKAIDNEHLARRQHDDAVKTATEAEGRCAYQLENAERANAIQKECEQAVNRTRDSAELGHRSVAAISQEIGAIMQQSAIHVRNASECERTMRILEIRAQEKVTELSDAASRLKAIEQLLADQQQVVDKAMAAANAVKSEVEAARAKVASEMQQSRACEERASQKQDELAKSEEQIVGLNDAHAQAAKMLRDAERALDAELAKTKDEDMKYKRCKDAESAASTNVAAAIRGVGEAEAHLRQVQIDREAYMARRASEHQEELMLLHQELTLRRQRESLMQKEAMLRANFSAFSRGGGQTPRCSTARVRTDITSPSCRP